MKMFVNFFLEEIHFESDRSLRCPMVFSMSAVHFLNFRFGMLVLLWDSIYFHLLYVLFQGNFDIPVVKLMDKQC